MAESDSWTVAGATEEIAITTLMWMVDGLREGTLDVPTVAKDLRTRGGPFRRIGEWLEERPVTASLAIGVLSAIAAIAGPQLADDSGSGVDEKEIVEIIDTVLDHYDQQLDRGQTSPPPAPAPQPKGAAQRRSEPRPDRSEPNN